MTNATQLALKRLRAVIGGGPATTRTYESALDDIITVCVEIAAPRGHHDERTEYDHGMHDAAMQIHCRAVEALAVAETEDPS